ncbi:hypothetical protein PVK06_001055 [Gossypium arboreum]|uniref:Uncharacterized protein n=1 Tax=Gossypium arboreum TaxID=29729 RepID=A0ABR0R121_GOSAR|nr:hypothetical protein PVK06_001055 [Gossypium arboreum]
MARGDKQSSRTQGRCSGLIGRVLPKEAAKSQKAAIMKFDRATIIRSKEG